MAIPIPIPIPPLVATLLKMAHLKNGLRLALAIYMAEMRPFLGFGGWNVRFEDLQAEICDSTQRAQTSLLGTKNAFIFSCYFPLIILQQNLKLFP